MKKIGLSVSMLAAAAFALAACGKSGPPITNQQQAGAAAMGANQAAGSAADGSSGAMKAGPLAWALQALTSVQTSSTVSCPKGGKVTATVNVNVGQQTGNLSYDISFDGCTIDFDDPSTATVEANPLTYDGTFTLTIDATGTDSGGSVAIEMKGDLDLSGAFGDSIDMDIQISGSSTDGTGQVSVSGSIKTDEASYSFDGSVTGGSTRAAPRG